MNEESFLASAVTGLGGRIVAGAWGAIWGSFFNVLILRLPSGESLLRPASHCRSCGASVAWYDNVPILSYLLLRGRCRRCGKRYSVRYLVVELLNTGLALALHQVYISASVEPVPLRLAQFFITSFFAGLLLAVAVIDLDTMKIPNAITYPGIPVAILLSPFFRPPHVWDGLAGAVAGYLLIAAIDGAYRLVTKRQGMGYGDAKLLAMIAGLLGWQSLFVVPLLASLQGSVFGISLLLWARHRQRRQRQPREEGVASRTAAEEGASSRSAAEEDSLRRTKIAFGPYLSLAAVELLLLRNYLSLVVPLLYPW